MCLAHYPAVPQDAFAHSTHIVAHSDFGSITLFQDNPDGLQAEYPPDSGEFVDIASAGPYECILNSGDCLQKLTGLRSVLHRVRLPNFLRGEEAGVKSGMLAERFSIAYFAEPDRRAVMRPLVDVPGARGVDETRFMTAGEFQLKRIQGTYA